MNVCDVSEFMGLGKSPRTAYAYARVMQRVLPLLEERGVDLLSCSAADVAVVAGRWPRSHASQGQLRAALAAAFELVGREAPPLRAVRVPPKARNRSKALSEEQAAALERRAWDRADAPGLSVLVGLYSALRCAEIASLAPGQFTAQADGMWLTVMGKGEVVEDLPVHPVLEAALARCGPYGRWVFPGRPGRPGHVCPATIWNWTHLVAGEAGLGRSVHTHRLRHTALTEMNDRSSDLRAVQTIARHSRPETTAGYTRTQARRMREVVGMIDYGRRLDEPEPAA